MNVMQRIRSRIGRKVRFKYPEGVRTGILVDRVVIPAGPNPHGIRYWHVVDLIQFSDRREPWIRIGYYRQAKTRLVFGGQTTASFRLGLWKKLFAKAGAERSWFGDLLRDAVQTRHSDPPIRPGRRDQQSDRQEECRGCGTVEGALHHFGCAQERCPFCGRQLISCDCLEAHIDTDEADDDGDGNYPAHVGRAWEALLTKAGRVPFIRYPNLCARCGAIDPAFFSVPDRVWKNYVELDMRGAVICRPCFDAIRNAIDGGAAKAKTRARTPAAVARGGSRNGRPRGKR